MAVAQSETFLGNYYSDSCFTEKKTNQTSTTAVPGVRNDWPDPAARGWAQRTTRSLRRPVRRSVRLPIRSRPQRPVARTSRFAGSSLSVGGCPARQGLAGGARWSGGRCRGYPPLRARSQCRGPRPPSLRGCVASTPRGTARRCRSRLVGSYCRVSFRTGISIRAYPTVEKYKYLSNNGKVWKASNSRGTEAVQ